MLRLMHEPSVQAPMADVIMPVDAGKQPRASSVRLNPGPALPLHQVGTRCGRWMACMLGHCKRSGRMLGSGQHQKHQNQNPCCSMPAR